MRTVAPLTIYGLPTRTATVVPPFATMVGTVATCKTALFFTCSSDTRVPIIGSFLSEKRLIIPLLTRNSSGGRMLSVIANIFLRTSLYAFK